MRKWLFALTLLIAYLLDTMFFNVINIYGIRPDMLLTAVVSLGFLLGPAPAAAAGVIAGLLVDIIFNKIVGLTSLMYLFAGVGAGFFYRKFYADNLIIPAVTAMVCAFVKEHVFLIAAKLCGARPPYFLSLAAYILPSMLLTGGVCALVHLFLKHNLFRPLWRKESIDIK